MVKKLAPIHPGDFLRTEFLEPLRLSQTRLGIDLRVPATRINDLVNGRRAITAETALRLARYFGTSAEFWMNLQTRYELAVAEDMLAQRIERDVQPRVA
jgi:addiction module HigA family antidote